MTHTHSLTWENDDDEKGCKVDFPFLFSSSLRFFPSSFNKKVCVWACVCFWVNWSEKEKIKLYLIFPWGVFNIQKKESLKLMVKIVLHIYETMKKHFFFWKITSYAVSLLFQLLSTYNFCRTYSHGSLPAQPSGPSCLRKNVAIFPGSRGALRSPSTFLDFLIFKWVWKLNEFMLVSCLKVSLIESLELFKNILGDGVVFEDNNYFYQELNSPHIHLPPMTCHERSSNTTPQNIIESLEMKAFWYT